jgi:hypothetical protein
VPKKGYTQSNEHRRKIAAGVAAARTGTSQSVKTRERIAEAQRRTWAVRQAEKARMLRQWAAQAKDDKWKAKMLREAERLDAKLKAGRSSGG